MKWLTTLLVIYLLGLSLWPCADEFLPAIGQAGAALALSAAMVKSDPSNPAGTGHHEHDTCTPFCTCTCCAATITIVPRFHYSLIASVNIVPIAVANFHYASTHPLDAVMAIWQPPQLRI